MPKPVLGPRRRTNPLIWCVAIICAVITVAVIIAGVAIFVVYLVVKPRVPQMSITQSQLDNIYFDQSGLLTIQVSIILVARNDNHRAIANFYSTTFNLIFYGRTIARLAAVPFVIPANRTLQLNYVVQSSPIPLDPRESDVLSGELRQGIVVVEVTGTTRTRWSAGVISPVTLRLSLDCELRLPINGSTVYPRCTTRAQ